MDLVHYFSVSPFRSYALGEPDMHSYGLQFTGKDTLNLIEPLARFRQGFVVFRNPRQAYLPAITEPSRGSRIIANNI
jgi:hypothetical protein